MIDLDVDIPTRDGTMNSFITHPEEGGPHPVVLFYMDAAGKREALHDIARRVGTAGYYVILPNLYYREIREFDASADLAANADRLFQLIATLDYAKIESDTQSLLDYVDADPAARSDRVGALGYCMSGPFVYAMAGTFPDRVQAAASIHGVRLHGDESPEALAKRVTGELYFGCAETDPYAPQEMIDALEAHLRNLELRARVEWYWGCQHGFAIPDSVGNFDKQASERHFERVLDLFDRNLRR